MKTYQIKVAIIGIGRHATALVDGVAHLTMTGSSDGLVYELIGGYEPADIQFVAAYDADPELIGLHLSKAIHMNGVMHSERANRTSEALKAMTGTITPDATVRHVYSFAENIKATNADVVVIALPDGDKRTTEYAADACIQAGIPFVNCTDTEIAATLYWEARAGDACIPIMGDDLQDQVDHQHIGEALHDVMFQRGIEPADGPIEPYYVDDRIAQYRFSGTAFGGATVTIEAQVRNTDKANSAVQSIDAIRYLKTAHEMQLVGCLRGPSAATHRRPPELMPASLATDECDRLAARQLTDSTEIYNLLWADANDRSSEATSSTDSDDVSKSR